MCWLLLGAIFGFGCILALYGTLRIARDLIDEVEVTAVLLPSEDLSHALVIFDDLEQS